MQHDDSPQVAPRGQRSGGSGSGTPPTAIGVQTPGRKFLVVNDTYASCSLSSDSEPIIELGQREESLIYVGQGATLTATLICAAPVRFEVEIREGRWGMLIRTVDNDRDRFELVVLERRSRPIALARTADVAALNLLSRSENLLKHLLAINTVDRALRMDPDAVLALRQYPFFTLFDLAEQLHGLLILR